MNIYSVSKTAVWMMAAVIGFCPVAAVAQVFGNGDFSSQTPLEQWTASNNQSLSEHQEEAALFRTGFNGALVTLSHGLSSQPVGTRLEFDFGFSTQESASPGKFLDSWTVTLQNAAKTQTAIFLTADATGVRWAPPSENAMSLSEGTIFRTPTTPPAGLALHQNSIAYHVAFEIPMAFGSDPLVLFLDLFDNQDAVQSLAWTDNFVLVPEPALTWLTAAGLVAFAVARATRLKRKNR